MKGKITIDTERCKGCGLCVKVCPNNCIEISQESNKAGYFPAVFTNENCTGCAMCALICPDAIIRVTRTGDIPIQPVQEKKKAEKDVNQETKG